MAIEVERFIKVQNPRKGVANEWRTIPNCDKLRVWEMSTAELPDEGSGLELKRFIFHIGYADGILRGSRVSYLGQHFTVLSVSDSTRLRGLELNCQTA